MSQLRKTQALLARSQDRIRELEQSRRPTSSNSSIAPSANPIGAPRPTVKKPTGRKPGAQIGHVGRSRRLVPVEQVNRVIEHRPTACQRCHALLDQTARSQVVGRHQVAELPEVAVMLTEHQSLSCRCERCGTVTRGLIPPDIAASSTGPRLTAAIGIWGAWVKGSRRAVAEVVAKTLGCPIALGSISARERELSDSLEQPYLDLAASLSLAPVKYVDETSWKLHGQERWLFVAANQHQVVFRIEKTRTHPSLLRLLNGKARGTICSDRCGIYDLWPLDKRQVCWAHLKRDFVAMAERDKAAGTTGTKALEITAQVFDLWHSFKDKKLTRTQLREGIKPLAAQMHQALEAGARGGPKKTAGVCRRLLKCEQALWRFCHTPGLDPTNNLAERMLRPAVIWRKKSFGCHSQAGCDYVQRMLSVIQTLRLRSVNVLDYLSAAVQAHRKGLSPPAIPKPLNGHKSKAAALEKHHATQRLDQDLRKIA
jgi:transposase